MAERSEVEAAEWERSDLDAGLVALAALLLKFDGGATGTGRMVWPKGERRTTTALPPQRARRRIP